MAAPFIVGKVCKAEELIAEAEKLLLEARSNVISLRDENEPVAGELKSLFEELSRIQSSLRPVVKRVAALIDDGE